MSFLDTRHKKKSFTLTTLLLSVLLLLLFYIGLTYMDPPEENGITVNFGQTDYGRGKVQPKEKIKSNPAKTEPEEVKEEIKEEKPFEQTKVEKETVKENISEKVLTQDSEEAIVIKKKQEAKRKADQEAKEAKEAKEKAERLEKKRIAEQKAKEKKERKEKENKRNQVDNLFGDLNRSNGTTQGGDGSDNKTGDNGRPTGDPYAASYYGTPGAGNGTSAYGLGGRNIRTKGKVQQDCNEEGRVVVKIIVDRSGKVISATPGVKGTTNNHPCLLEPAKKTAYKHTWNMDSNAPSKQTGFVVVNFKLGE